jgi:hypothetical protein
MDDSRTWYVLYTSNRHESLLRDFLRKKGLCFFVPVEAIRNIAFVCSSSSEKELAKVMFNCPCPIRMLKYRDSDRLCTFTESEMNVFRKQCETNAEEAFLQLILLVCPK